MSPFMTLQPILNPHEFRVFSPLAGCPDNHNTVTNIYWVPICALMFVLYLVLARLMLATSSSLKLLFSFHRKDNRHNTMLLFFFSANQIDPAMPASGLIIAWHIVLTIIRQVITEGITAWGFPLLLCEEEESQISPISPHNCRGQQRDRHSCDEPPSTYQWNTF